MVRIIEISVRDRVAWQTNKMEYICGNGNNGDFVVEFDFDDEWENVYHKTARFIHGEQHTDVLFTGNQCEVPVIMGVNRMEVGVYAGNLRTTTPAMVLCKKSILCKDGIPADPPPDVYTQVMEMLKNGVSDEQIAQAVADYLTENPIDTGVQFETDATLKLENGILSVNTTDQMEQDNTLPITSAGVYATVGNIEALLKTI